MSILNFELLKIRGTGRRVLHGAFKPNGAGTIDNTVNKGGGQWTAARTGVGTYTITWSANAGFNALESFVAFVQLNAVAATLITGNGAFSSAASGVVNIAVLTESAGTFAAAEIAANANNWIHFIAIFKETAILP